MFCIGEGTKTWGHGREQAILSRQFLGYLYLLVFSEKRNRLTGSGFCHSVGKYLAKNAIV